jgi:hypothetical protein
MRDRERGAEVSALHQSVHQQWLLDAGCDHFALLTDIRCAIIESPYRVTGAIQSFRIS